jgi:beta-carotene 15,15'-dioxygenase
MLAPLVHMTSLISPSFESGSRGAALISVRRWFIPASVLVLGVANHFWVAIDGLVATAITAAIILLVGIPHGTLDVEIAALRFGRQDVGGKLKIIVAYLACAAAMALLWAILPSLALIVFLALSIVHFGADWREDGDGFFAMMVGWALIAAPALFHPDSVAAIFEMLTSDHNGAAIAALLACSSIPAIGGSLIFAAKAINRTDHLNGINVLSCLVAAVVLPPLAGFAVFFCGLHSPRHLAEAIEQSGATSLKIKILIGCAVMALSLGAAALLFLHYGPVQPTASIIRTVFVLLSILTVPHFILEQLQSRQEVSPLHPKRLPCP